MHCLTQRLHFVLPLFPLLTLVFLKAIMVHLLHCSFFIGCANYHNFFSFYILYLLLVKSIHADVLIFSGAVYYYFSNVAFTQFSLGKHIHIKLEPFAVLILAHLGSF